MFDLTPLINSDLSRELQALLYLLGYQSEKKSFKVYAVGGFVRDLLLGRENRDLDLVVDGSAVEFAKSLLPILPGRLRCYERFGTATLILPKGIVFDMVTARKEFYAAPGALPTVEQSTLKNDLYRRDFTINTMACALNPGGFGRLYDFFGGRKDLEKGIIRVLYNLSFVDDPLRIIRAVRFEQRFNFTIEEESAVLLRNAIAARILEKVSKERLYNEVRLIFREKFPVRVLLRLEELGLFKELFPRLALSRQVKERLERLGQLLPTLSTESKNWNLFLLYLAVLFYGLAEHEIGYLCQLMRLKGKERRALLSVLKNSSSILSQLQEPSLRSSRLFFLLEKVPEEGLIFFRVLADDPLVHERIIYYREYLAGRKASLTGKDLFRLGLKPGPLYRKVLHSLQEAVLDETVRGREQELEYVTFLLHSNILEEEAAKGEQE